LIYARAFYDIADVIATAAASPLPPITFSSPLITPRYDYLIRWPLLLLLYFDTIDYAADAMLMLPLMPRLYYFISFFVTP